jgi:peptidoglycan hydrolase-like protein with peptidoglycan-binding domain
MRNTFNLTQEERSRILNLHETSTKNQYLDVINEQVTPFDHKGKMIEIQNILKTKGYTVSKDGNPDGKFGPLTYSALTAALQGSSASSGGEIKTPVDVLSELMKNPEVKAIAEKLKAAGVDLTKMQPAEILPKVQELAADVLKASPNLINTVKTQIESLMNIKLPELTNATNNSTTEVGKDDGAMDSQGLKF